VAATCASSTADTQVAGHEQYSLLLSMYVWACCSCPDFGKNWGVCKHLWAFRLYLPGALASRLLPLPLYLFHFLDTETEAQEIYNMCFGMSIPGKSQASQLIGSMTVAAPASSTLSPLNPPSYSPSDPLISQDTLEHANAWLNNLAEAVEDESGGDIEGSDPDKGSISSEEEPEEALAVISCPDSSFYIHNNHLSRATVPV
jgi:hypothetical protein